MKRLVIAILAFVGCLGVAHVAQSKSVQDEFAQAWSARADRYTAQQADLDKLVEATLSALKVSNESNAPDVGARTNQFLAALNDGSYLHGRSAVLAAFRTHIKGKPSAAVTELWIQERFDELKNQATSLDATGDRLRNDNSPEGIKAKMTALANSAEFMGNVAEMKLLDENLGTYFKAKSAQDDARRRARAAFFGALAGSARSYGSQSSPPRTTTCHSQSFGNTITCTGN